MENISNSEYPIIVDDKNIGTVTVSEEGLHTIFEGRCAEPEASGLFRLSVYGECEGYLGVMMPERGYLRIRKKLSRASMKDFPKEIKYAGMAGMANSANDIAEANTEEENEANGKDEKIDSEKPGKENAGDENVKDNDNAPGKGGNEEKPAPSKPETVEVFDMIENSEVDITWNQLPDATVIFSTVELKQSFRGVGGALASRQDDEVVLLAIPVEEGSKFPPISTYKVTRAREIEGIKYVIIKVKNGEIS